MQRDARRLLDRALRAREIEIGGLLAAVGIELGDDEALAPHPLGQVVAGIDGLLVRGPDQPEAGPPGDEAPRRTLLLAFAANELGVDGLAAVDAVARHPARELVAFAEVKLSENEAAVLEMLGPDEQHLSVGIGRRRGLAVGIATGRGSHSPLVGQRRVPQSAEQDQAKDAAHAAGADEGGERHGATRAYSLARTFT